MPEHKQLHLYREKITSHDGSFYFKFIIISTRYLVLSSRPKLSLVYFYQYCSFCILSSLNCSFSISSNSLPLQCSEVIQFSSVPCHHVNHHICPDCHKFNILSPQCESASFSSAHPSTAVSTSSKRFPHAHIASLALLCTNSFLVLSFLSFEA